MSYNNSNQTNSNQNEDASNRINLDEVIEDEFNLSKKKKPINDSKNDEKPTTKINLNEDL